MKSKPINWLIIGVSLLAAASGGWAQPAATKGKTLAGKIYLAETKGQTEVRSHDKTYTAQQATSFDAPGTVIETKANSHNAFVYSNGTGLYMDQNTRLEINRFTQEPFLPAANRLNPNLEPSISQSNILVARGAVGICTNQLIPGTTMSYETPLGVVNIRDGRIAIETKPGETIVDLLEGDITVVAGGKELGAKVMQPGERATIHPAADAAGLPVVTITPIPRELLQTLDERASIACNAKKTVSFDVNDKTDAEIVPKPTIPANLPANITVSPDRLP